MSEPQFEVLVGADPVTGQLPAPTEARMDTVVAEHIDNPDSDTRASLNATIREEVGPLVPPLVADALSEDENLADTVAALAEDAMVPAFRTLLIWTERRNLFWDPLPVITGRPVDGYRWSGNGDATHGTGSIVDGWMRMVAGSSASIITRSSEYGANAGLISQGDYVLSLDCETSAGVADPELTFNTYASGGALIRNVVQVAPRRTNDGRLWFPIKIAAGEGRMSLQLRATKVDGSSYFRVRRTLLEAGVLPGEFFYGGSADTASTVHAWDGASNASPSTRQVGRLPAALVAGRPGIVTPEPTESERIGGDWAPALNRAFAEGGIVQLPAGMGPLPVKTTTFIPEGHELHGSLGTWLALQQGHTLTDLTGYPRREAGGACAIVTNERPATGTIKSVAVRHLTVVGDTVGPQVLTSGYLQHGILFLDAESFEAESVTVTDVNHDAELVPPGGWSQAYGFGVAAVRSVHGRIVDSYSARSGYENFAIYDGCEDIEIIRAESGEAWRTGFQVHRGAQDIRVRGLRVRQTNPLGAAVTIHGTTEYAITGLSMLGLDLESDGAYALQFVDAGASFSEFGGRCRSATNAIQFPWVSETVPLGATDMRFLDVDAESANRPFNFDRGVASLTLQGGRYARPGDTSQSLIYLNNQSGQGEPFAKLRLLDFEAINPNGSALRLGGFQPFVRPIIRGVRMESSSNGVLFANAAVQQALVYGNDFTQAATPINSDTSGHEIFGNLMPV